MSNGVVYAEEGVYAGWPANHGGWQWGGELLVGFLRGAAGKNAMHNILEPFQKVLARSTDDGETWALEVPGVDFECVEQKEAPAFDLADSIIRVCGVYDHGGDYCDERGGFYLSRDRGRQWEGPYLFTGLEEQFGNGLECSGRTCVADGLVFLSRKDAREWGRDSTFCATHDGKRFHFKAWVSDDAGRAVMPAASKVGSRLVVTLRRRGMGRRGGWVDAFGSDDGGATWRFLSEVGETGKDNGNPSALVALSDGRLVCVFGNRTEKAIKAAVSSDGGQTWCAPHAIRDGGRSDIGYPRLFAVSDGLLAIYYWSDSTMPQQHIAWTRFSV